MGAWSPGEELDRRELVVIKRHPTRGGSRNQGSEDHGDRSDRDGGYPGPPGSGAREGGLAYREFIDASDAEPLMNTKDARATVELLKTLSGKACWVPPP